MKDLAIKTLAAAFALFVSIWLELMALAVVGLYKLLLYAERMGP
jgi:hypothetical protein